MALRTKLLIGDRDLCSLLRCDSDGTNPNRWGLFCSKLNAPTGNNVLGGAWDDAAKKAYYAIDNGGMKYTDYNDFSGGSWSAAGGQLAHDRCFGAVISPDGSKVATFHDSYVHTADCVDTATNVQAWSRAHAAWDLNKGLSGNSGTYLFGWDWSWWGLTAGVLALIRFSWSDGSNLACSWVPPENCYVYDIDVDDNDEYLYAVVCFTSTPAGMGTTKNAIVKIKVSDMSFVSLSYISSSHVPEQSYDQLYANIDVTCDYFVYTYYQSSPTVEWLGKIFRLSTMTLVGAYSETSSPKWNANRASWSTISCWAVAIKDTHTLVNYTMNPSYDAPVFSCMAVNPTSLALTLRWNAYGTSDAALSEYQWDGTNYIDRKWPWQTGFLVLPVEICAAGSDNFLFCYRETNGVWLVDRDFPFREPTQIARSSNGAVCVADAKSRRVWKYDDYGGSLVGAIPSTVAATPKGFLGLSLDETDSRIVLWDDRTNSITWFDDFAWANLVMGVISYCNDVFQQDSHITWASEAAVGDDTLWKYTDEDFGAGTWTRPTATIRKFVIDPDDGKFYIGTHSDDTVVRMDDENGLNLVSYGGGGAGVGQFDVVFGVAVDGTYCYAVDKDNHRVAKFEKAPFDGTGWSTFGSEGLFGNSLKMSDAYSLVAYEEVYAPKAEETVSRQVWDRVPQWPMGCTSRVPSRQVRYEGAREGKILYQTDYGFRAWELSYLEDKAGLTAIRSFFGDRSGKYEYFLWKNPEMYQRSGVSVGTGNGSRTEWRLPDDPIIDDSETIYVDGAPQTRDVNYAICNASGLIVFTSPPAPAAAITADYQFYHRVVADMPALRVENDGFERYRITVNVRETSPSKINRS